MCVFVCLFVCVCKCVYMCVFVCLYVCMYVSVSMSLFLCVCVRMCMCGVFECVYVCMCICDLMTGWYLIALVITTTSLPKLSVVEEQEKTKSERRKKATMFVEQLRQKRAEKIAIETDIIGPLLPHEYKYCNRKYVEPSPPLAERLSGYVFPSVCARMLVRLCVHACSCVCVCVCVSVCVYA